MNENQFEQLVAQMLSGMKSATDWTIETQRREIDDHDRKLAAAEAVLGKALDFVSRERARIRGQAAQASPQLRELHDRLNKDHPTPEQGRIPGKQNIKQPF